MKRLSEALMLKVRIPRSKIEIHRLQKITRFKKKQNLRGLLLSKTATISRNWMIGSCSMANTTSRSSPYQASKKTSDKARFTTKMMMSDRSRITFSSGAAA